MNPSQQLLQMLEMDCPVVFVCPAGFLFIYLLIPARKKLTNKNLTLMQIFCSVPWDLTPIVQLWSQTDAW